MIKQKQHKKTAPVSQPVALGRKFGPDGKRLKVKDGVKYTSDKAGVIYDMVLDGESERAIARYFGVEAHTIKNWKTNYPTAQGAFYEAQQERLKIVENALYKAAEGYTVMEHKALVVDKMIEIVKVKKEYKPDVRACDIILRNKGEGWNAKESQNNTQINIGESVLDVNIEFVK